MDQADLGIQCHPADLAEIILNKTKPKKCRQHVYSDGKQEYLEDNYIYLWTGKSDSRFPLDSWRASWATFPLRSNTR